MKHTIEDSTEILDVQYDTVMGPEWRKELQPLLLSDYMDNLAHYTNEIYKATEDVYPREKAAIFKAFRLTPPNNVKVIMFADEPFQDIRANGLAFGMRVANGVALNKQQKAIESVMKDCYGEPMQIELDVTMQSWAEEGVLLLNTSLVSQKGHVMAHELAFRNFTREVIKCLNDTAVELIFVFTNKDQQTRFRHYIDEDFHTVLAYDAFDENSSILEDINNELIEANGTRNAIQW